MADSVYRVTELIGTSSQSWEAAARAAVETAAKTLRDLRVAEVVEQDMTIENGKVTSYRVKLNVSFKYLPEAGSAKTATTRRRWLPLRARWRLAAGSPPPSSPRGPAGLSLR